MESSNNTSEIHTQPEVKISFLEYSQVFRGNSVLLLFLCYIWVYVCTYFTYKQTKESGIIKTILCIQNF